MTLHGEAGDVGASKSGSDCDVSSLSSSGGSQSGGGGAVAVSARDGTSFAGFKLSLMSGNGFKVDANIGAKVVDGGLGGELGGVSFRVGAEELAAVVSESRGRLSGAAFGGIGFCVEAEVCSG